MKPSKFIAFNSAKKLLPKSGRWLTVCNSGEAAEMIISGQIGKDWWDDSGTSAKEFRNELKQIPAGKKINVRINSEGGSIQDGLEIYNALKDRRTDVTCHVDGYAVSIASIIALAGGRTVSPKSCVWMIHDPWSFTQGNADDHKRSAEMLDKHGDTLAAIYADETGHSKEEMRDAMKKETWFTGNEATEYGLADETPKEDTQAAFAALDVSKFQNIPDKVRKLIAAGKKISNAIAGAEPQPKNEQIMNKAQILALLKKHGITPPENATDEELSALVEKLPAPAAPPANHADDLAAIKAQLLAEKRARIAAQVADIALNRLPADQVESWIDRCMADEKILADLRTMPVNMPGGEPLHGRVQILSENPLEKIKREKKAANRFAMLRGDWTGLFADAVARDSRRGAAQGSNTYSGTLVTAFLLDGAVTVLQNRWAALKCFTLDFSTDRYKPKATAELKTVASGATTQTNATNFESGDSVVNPTTITVSQYTQAFNVSNSDLNSGLRMENLVTVNAAAFADKIIEVATTPITAANFATLAPFVSNPALFDFGSLKVLWGQLKKAHIRNALLDGEYLANLVNQPTYFQVTTEGAVADTGMAFQRFGWNRIELNTNWTGAGANVRGFACDPQAIAAVAGLPLTPPNGIPGNTLQESTMLVEGLDISIASYDWFNLATRTAWHSYDLMFGATACDTTAGVLITSA